MGIGNLHFFHVLNIVFCKSYVTNYQRVYSQHITIISPFYRHYILYHIYLSIYLYIYIYREYITIVFPFPSYSSIVPWNITSIHQYTILNQTIPLYPMDPNTCFLRYLDPYGINPPVVPSCNLLHSSWKWPIEVVDLPIQAGDFPVRKLLVYQ